MCKVNLVLSVRTMTSIASEQELWRQPYGVYLLITLLHRHRKSLTADPL
jgi:hypothetical protein